MKNGSVFSSILVDDRASPGGLSFFHGPRVCGGAKARAAPKLVPVPKLASQQVEPTFFVRFKKPTAPVFQRTLQKPGYFLSGGQHDAS